MKKFAYPLLERVAELYAGANLENVLLLASQHLLEPQLQMFKLLFSSGLKPENCIIVGKCYSTNLGVMRDLIRRGCVVAPFSSDFNPLRPFDEWFEENLASFVAREIGKRRLNDYRKVVVLDDGGFMHLALNNLSRDLSNVVGIEQTSSGHRRIQHEGVRFPTISVARSIHKLTFESPHIGRNGYERIARHLAMRGKDHPKMLVFGLGPIGRQTAGQLLLVQKYDGCVTDIRLDDHRVISHGAVQLLRNHGKVITVEAARERIGEFDVIIGCAGSPVFTKKDIDRLHPDVSLISMSSSDREFPAVSFRHGGGKVHEDYYRSGRCLVNAGFPVTFDGKPHAMPPQQIELTIALMQIRLLHEVNDCSQCLPYVVDQIFNMWLARNA